MFSDSQILTGVHDDVYKCLVFADEISYSFPGEPGLYIRIHIMEKCLPLNPLKSFFERYDGTGGMTRLTVRRGTETASDIFDIYSFLNRPDPDISIGRAHSMICRPAVSGRIRFILKKHNDFPMFIPGVVRITDIKYGDNGRICVNTDLTV